ncbi:FliO/MopB family protein [Spirochaetota bacterium]
MSPVILLSQVNNKTSVKSIDKIERKVENKISPGHVKKSDITKKTGVPGSTADKQKFGPVTEEESYGWLVFKTIIVLGAIIGGFYFFIRYASKRTGIRVMGQDLIKVLSVAPIGQNKHLQIIDLAGKILVLGVADNSINLVTEITDKDEIDRIRLLGTKSTSVKAGGFQDYIVSNIGRAFGKVKDSGTVKKNTGNKPVGDSGVDLSSLKGQKDRLRKLNGFGNE